MSVEIVPATAALMRQFYGDLSGPTVRGVVALEGGVPIAVGGFSYHDGKVFLFSDLKPQAKRYPVTLVKVARKLLRGAKGVVYATCDPDEPTAPALLKRLGFEPYGEVYRCQV